MSDINTPARQEPDAERGAEEEAELDDEMSSDDVQPPPVDVDLPGMPDASNALEEARPDEPGANATGVGV
jgi:hypothetical protein